MKNEKTEQFLRLVKENPDLPILPMVWDEVVADNTSCYWGGSFEGASVEKVWNGSEEWHFYDDSDTEEQIKALEDTDCWRESATDYYEMEDTKIKEEYDNLPWEERIVVFIGMPD